MIQKPDNSTDNDLNVNISQRLKKNYCLLPRVVIWRRKRYLPKKTMHLASDNDQSFTTSLSSEPKSSDLGKNPH